MRIKLTQEEVERRLNDMEIAFKPFVYKNSKTTLFIQCPKCDKYREVRCYKFITTRKTAICKECFDKNKKLTQEEAEKRLKEIGVVFKPFIYTRNQTNIEIQCIECKSWHKISWWNCVQREIKKCRNCSYINAPNKSFETVKKNRPDKQKKIEKELHDKGIDFLPFTFISKSKTIISFKCPSCKEIKKTSIRNILDNNKILCRHCSHGRSRNDVKKNIEEDLINRKIQYKPFIYKNKYSTIEIQCPICLDWRKTGWNNISRQDSAVCFECRNIQTNSIFNQSSNGELDVVEYIKTLGYKVEKKIIKGKEIDIFLSEINIGFEYHGDYWHANPIVFPLDYNKFIDGKTMNEIHEKDRKKIEFFDSIGIKVYVIWEYDWKNHREKTENRILEIINSYKYDNKRTN